MKPDRWREVDELFARALELPEGARGEFLGRACAGREELRGQVEGLLAADAAAATFLEGGAEREVTGPATAKVGPYRLIRRVREGGMGAVFEAVRDDDEYQRRVAVKLLRGGLGGAEAALRFRAERQILAQLEHPNIARLYDGGRTEEGSPYLVMEFIEGWPIDEYCARNRLTVEARLELFRAVCLAVQHAHQNLLVHRDIKPGNILVTADGVPKLLDFGIAKPLAPGPSPLDLQVTRTGLRPMTLAYASPEQVRGGPITTGTDVYGLGVLLYELLTGRPPFGAGDTGPAELERAILEREPRRPSEIVLAAGEPPETQPPLAPAELARRLRGDLDNIVLTALRKEPERRYSSVEQLAEDVRRHLRQLPVRARPDTLAYRTGKFVSRHRLGVTVAAALAAVVIGLLATVVLQARRVAHQSAVAEQRRAEAALERDKAERALAFLVDLFETADPGEGLGETVTARQILDSGAARLSRELAGQPVLRATLLDAIGRVYVGLGLYAEAQPLLEEALAARRRALGATHPEVAASLHNLALLHQHNGELAEAETLYRRALALRRGRLGGAHPDVAVTLARLGDVVRRLGRNDEAEPLLRQALAIHRRTLGPQHPEVAEDLAALAELEQNRGNYSAAERLQREGLAIRRRVHGDDHIAVAEALSRLSSPLSDQARYAEAADLLRQALAIQRRLLDPEHPDIAGTLNDLAFTVQRNGDHRGAEALYREALAHNRRRLAPDHPQLATNLNNIGSAVMFQGRLDEAEALQREALAIRRRAYGESHPEVAQSLSNVAEVLRRKRDFPAAERFQRQALAMLRATVGEDHLLVSHPLIGLGNILTDAGDLAGAEQALREGLELRRRHLAPGHWIIASAEGKLGACLLARGRYAEAEDLLARSHRTLAAQFGDDDSRVVEARARLDDVRQRRAAGAGR